jgi:cellulose synthase/poly-beta-1,6-N-acetylglucosamine synthase-like glycosyltransferase
LRASGRRLAGSVSPGGDGPHRAGDSRASRHHAHKGQRRRPRDPFPPDIAFLTAYGVPDEELDRAARLAEHHRTVPSHELFAAGLDHRRYWSALADHLGLAYVDDLSGMSIVANAGMLVTDAVRLAASVMVRDKGGVVLVLAPQHDEIALLARHLAETPALASRIRIATPDAIRAFLVAQRHTALTHYAVNRLARVLPRISASRLGQARGASGPIALVAAALALALLSPATAVKAAGLLATAFFFNCSLWRMAAALRRARGLRLEPVSDPHLPCYTVLVPLYREAAIAPDLVRNMKRIDYPRSKLQILIIVEADDRETRATVARHAVTHPFEIVVVPPGAPRTKPKALTYALPFARGELVAVFDAEDRPEPDQLRRAAAAFRERPDLGCVQARLTPDNEGSWYARMFALEYAANFDVLLPALADWGVPMPLGGTSNHFPRVLLEKVAAWDPFNVTEDADLGIRLARFGHRSATIFSRTYEEAPVTIRQWLPQRRRWIKGWMQTVTLCLGKGIPQSLRLSLRQQLAVHGILSAGVLGLLLYPVSLVVVAAAAVAALNGHWPAGSFAWALLTLNLTNLFAVLAAAILSAARGLRAAGAAHLIWHIPFLPAYWALMSFAAWQALFQFFRRPSEWEKTTHGVARDRRKRRPALP